MNSALVRSAMICASVVLPVPGGPQKMIEPGIVALDLHAQRFAGADQMFLSDELIERARTHAIGQRPRCVASATGIRDGLEQADKTRDYLSLTHWGN